jgi:hypothetical protein
MLAKKRAAASLSRAGTMVWFKMIVIQLLGVIERTTIASPAWLDLRAVSL